ncbi:MAG: outer membrane beta-barrel protein [Gemmatimonadota bacterium]|nr:MAG: outer membrane beta-barrel protein [Gemmatimonadota bacterium]
MRFRYVAVTVVVGVTVPQTVFSQVTGVPPGFKVGAAIGYNTLGGDDFDGLDPGFGFHGFLGYMTPAGFTISGGVQYSTHGVDGIDENAHVLGVYVEPRYSAKLASPSVAPFIGGRAYWVRYTLNMAWVGDASSSGFAFAGIGGIVFQVAPQFALEPAVTFMLLSFGEAKVDGETIPDTDMQGNSLGLHLAFVISFPSH